MRLRLDAGVKSPRFLVNASHGRHFIATRDHAVLTGSVSTFKSCTEDADDIDFDSERKDGLLQYMAYLFGRVESVIELVRRLRWPLRDL
jgi:hypothetical protein